jgi:hypothetical protein
MAEHHIVPGAVCAHVGPDLESVLIEVAKDMEEQGKAGLMPRSISHAVDPDAPEDERYSVVTLFGARNDGDTSDIVHLP